MEEDLKKSLQGIWDEYQKSKDDPVEIGLLGQPGAGKSWLINRIIGRDDAPVGVTTDYTKDRGVYPWNEITLVDLPGYGTKKFPAKAFLERFAILKFDALLCVASQKYRIEDGEFFTKSKSGAKGAYLSAPTSAVSAIRPRQRTN